MHYSQSHRNTVSSLDIVPCNSDSCTRLVYRKCMELTALYAFSDPRVTKRALLSLSCKSEGSSDKATCLDVLIIGSILPPSRSIGNSVIGSLFCLSSSYLINIVAGHIRLRDLGERYLPILFERDENSVIRSRHCREIQIFSACVRA